MNTIAMKFQTGTAALAIAAAAALIPVSAQAAPSISMPTAPVTQVLQDLSLGPAALPEYNWWFYGVPPSPTDPGGGITLFSFDVPVLFWQSIGVPINHELCFFGLGFKINAYGTLSSSFKLGGC